MNTFSIFVEGMKPNDEGAEFRTGLYSLLRTIQD